MYKYGSLAFNSSSNNKVKRAKQGLTLVSLKDLWTKLKEKRTKLPLFCYFFVITTFKHPISKIFWLHNGQKSHACNTTFFLITKLCSRRVCTKVYSLKMQFTNAYWPFCHLTSIFLSFFSQQSAKSAPDFPIRTLRTCIGRQILRKMIENVKKNSKYFIKNHRSRVRILYVHNIIFLVDRVV